jgi:heme oxygenase (biliverdin-IX-beta and delta-forming)
MRSVNLARTGGGALEELRSATSHCHRRLERRLDIARRFADRTAYRDYLEGMFGYHCPFEQSLSRHPVRRFLPDYAERRKADLLAADLMAMGATPDSIGALRHCAKIPLGQDEASALGSLYVLEGATLGGQVLLQMVEQRLQLNSHTGAGYLSSYGANVPAMWQRFCCAVEAWCTDSTRRAMAASAAVATFESLEEWLCGEPA